MEEFNTFDEELGMYKCTTAYWERLEKLKIYSLQRRRERYMILFLYKIMIGAYPNPGFDLSATTYDERNGFKIKPKLNLRAKQWVSTIRASSFFNRVPKLFNILPLELRDPKWLCVAPTKLNVDKFKIEVDKFLMKLPDQPTTVGRKRTALTNSILDQVHHMREE